MKQLQATNFAFAAVAKDGVVTWGIASAGGDSTAVQHRLSRVQRVVASNRAFAAILEDGRVATWGDPDAGGDCTEVQDQLRDVQQLVSTDVLLRHWWMGRLLPGASRRLAGTALKFWMN